MKKQISLRIDEDLYILIKNKQNLSRFINELIKDAVHAEKQRPIIETVKQALLSNEVFIGEIASRVSSGTPVSRAVEVDTTRQPIKSVTPGMERGCCSAKSPCSHWQYNGLDEEWVNTLSGRVISDAF